MVVKTAVRVRADYERFPKDWIFHDRWGKVKNSKTKRGAIIHEEVGSRTTAWVPGWQK
jgi:formamidopyrimidine-DNA glycosylase